MWLSNAACKIIKIKFQANKNVNRLRECLFLTDIKYVLVKVYIVILLYLTHGKYKWSLK